MEINDKTRIQFNDFRIEYFKYSPIWEFALDEEGEEDQDQDETTLKPRFDLKIADPSEGMFIVECEFISSSGNKYQGICTPSMEDSLGNIQPYILYNNELILFWQGMFKMSKSDRKRIYGLLNETPKTLFPLKYKALTSSKGVKLEGQIDGFMWIKSLDSKVKIVK